MSRVRPQTALLLTAQAALLALLLGHTAALLGLVGLAALWWLSGSDWRLAVWTLALLALGSWSFMVTQGLFYQGLPRTVLWQVLSPALFPWGSPPGLYLYSEGLTYGLVQSLRLHALVLLAAGLLARYGTDQLARGLRALGMPGGLCLTAFLALRQVPDTLGELHWTWLALRLRGLRPLRAPRGAAGLLGALLVPVLAGTVRRADAVAAALQGRGIDIRVGAGLVPSAMSRWERAIVLGGAMLLLALAAGLVGTSHRWNGALGGAWQAWHGWIAHWL